MARPREFNIEKAVEDAMNIFWEKGYHRASLSDLLDGMGIARGSFYKAFVSKKNLFLQALALYNVKYVTPAVEYLTADDKQAGLEKIQAVFDGVVEGVQNGDTRGCLLCNTAADSSSEDPDIAALVNKMLDRLTTAFGSALKNSPGYADENREARLSEARRFTLLYVGMKLLSRTGNDWRRLLFPMPT